MKATTKIYLRADYVKNSTGEHPIYIRYRANRQKTEISLNIFVTPECWNEKKNEVYRTDIDFSKKNKEIEHLITRANEIIHNATINNQLLTPKQFESQFKLEPSTSNSFFEFAENEMKSRIHEFSPSTINSYKKQISKLRKFCPSLLINEINISFIRKYHGYHLETLQDNENTTYAAHRWLKGMLNKAIEKDLIKENPYRGFAIKNPEGHREFLTIEELKKLELLYSQNKLKSTKQNVLQYFLFVCYTGLRYSDIKNLRYKNIIEIENNKKAISIIMQKTKDPITIPLNQKAEQFISSGFKEQKIFKVLVNQATNRYLKEIMKIAEIEKEVSFHCARHTFATVGLSIGIPMEGISNILGHRSLKTTQIYAKVQNESKVKYVELFDKI